MEYRHLGNSGVYVSEIALGSWLTYSLSVDYDAAQQIITTAYENGINFFDTADVYNNHGAERVLGQALSDIPRADLFIGSKVYGRVGEGPNDQGLSRKHIFEGIEASLEALDMEYLDLYQCHRYDEHTPLRETVRAMSDLVELGVVLYWGVSLWPADKIRQACRIADDMNGHRPVSNQPRYNLLDRSVEVNGVQETCADEGLGLVVYSPLAEGILTGKYAGGKIPEDSRAATDEINQFIQQKMSDESIKKSEELVDIADELDTSAAVLALAWLLEQKAMSSVIIGASKPSQVEENIKAVELEIPEGIMHRLNTLFPAGEDQHS